MNRLISFAAVLIILIVGLTLVGESTDSSKNKEEEASQNIDNNSPQSPARDGKIDYKNDNGKVKRPSIPFTAQNENEESLKYYIEIINKYVARPVEVVTLFEELEQKGLKPQRSHNKNEDTGELVVIRTKKTLPGTRYFHAQLFSRGDGTHSIQHLSFEFKPGKDSFKRGVAAAEALMKNHEARKTMDKDGYALWSLKSGHIVWVKKMTVKDLRDDPFNAYSKNDVGTIRVAMEEEIHPQYEAANFHN